MAEKLIPDQSEQLDLPAKRALPENIEKTNEIRRKKLVSISERFSEMISMAKIPLKTTLSQYNANLSKYNCDYVENKRYNKYCAINIVGKELYIENGYLTNFGKPVVIKRVFDTNKKACEEGIEIISGKIAEGYSKNYKKSEHKIDYVKAKSTENDKKEEEGNEGEGTEKMLNDSQDSQYEVVLEDEFLFWKEILE